VRGPRYERQLTLALRPDLFGFQPAPSLVDTATQMVYICRAPDVPGKFDNSKAVELKVPNGPIRGKLVRGETIEFDDPDHPGQKKVVTPEDVIGGGHEGAVSDQAGYGRESS